VVLWAALLLGAPVAGDRAARAEAPRRIGVVVSARVNLSAAAAQALSAGLGEAIHAQLPVDVLAGAEAERRLPPGGVPEECIASADCRLDLGRRLDAEELLVLVVVELAGRVQIDSTWCHVASGKVTSRPAVVIAPGADRVAVLRAAVPRLLPHIRPERAPPAPQVVVVSAPGEPASGRHFTAATWVATGVAAAALVGGTVFALSAARKFDSLDEDGCRSRACPGGDIDRLERHALAADVLFGVSTVSAVTGLVLYLRSGAAPRATPQVSVSASGTAMLGVGGVF
jgi:hypothetical protein